MRGVLLVLCSCAVAAPTFPASHPANPRAPAGLLVGAPATLRPGVVTYDLQPPRPPEQHHHQ